MTLYTEHEEEHVPEETVSVHTIDSDGNLATKDVSLKAIHSDNDNAGVEFTDRGPYIGLPCGARFYPFDPHPGDFCLRDIAVALSNQARFGGLPDYFYSVAQHSVIGSYLIEDLYGDRELARIFLMHDAPEAYIGDMVRPLKRAIPQFGVIEQGIWEAMAARYSLPQFLPDEVKYIDNVMCATEKRDLMPHSGLWSNMPPAEPEIIINPQAPKSALQSFLRRFVDLFPEHAEEAEGLIEMPAGRH